MLARLAFLAALLLLWQPGTRAATKPNVIVNFADDYGWHDLARNRLRLPSGYVTAPLATRCIGVSPFAADRYGACWNPPPSSARSPIGSPLAACRRVH